MADERTRYSDAELEEFKQLIHTASKPVGKGTSRSSRLAP